MRQEPALVSGTRASAVWGRGSKGGSRATSRGRHPLRAGTLLAALAAVVALGASGTAGATPPGGPPNLAAYVPATLLASAQASPKQSFQVIVQGVPGDTSPKLAKKLAKWSADDAASGSGSSPVTSDQITYQFQTIDGLAATLTGKQVLALARFDEVAAITPDAPLRLAGASPSNDQRWVLASGANAGWLVGGTPPAIAIVDTGIDASRADFTGRVRTQVDLTTLPDNSDGDGRGHGTFVASIAAGAAPGHAGVAPTAPLVSLDVMDDEGMARVSDVIAACDWIVTHKDAYNIRVANFSLQSSRPASIFFDPLDRAVEKLWLDGVVVVAAAGNYAVNGQPSGVLYAPGNDPFVITVGATDINNTAWTGDDFNAPWSAYGYTYDGFAKPELAAPGRYIVGAVSPSATLATEQPGAVVEPGYMQLSGTSFSAPVVSGAAADLLALHPGWTPDQVKGALMVTAARAGKAAPLSVGVGEVNVARALRVQSPPNPNAGLEQFVGPDPWGSSIPALNVSAWQSAARSSAAWSSVAWSSAAWSTAAWSSAAWSSAAWSSAAWSTAAWSTAAWSTSAWTDAAWSTAAWSDNADGDAAPGEATTQATPAETAAALAAQAADTSPVP